MVATNNKDINTSPTLPQKAVRNASFELLRIISMLMIITMHINLHGTFLSHVTGGANFVILKIFDVFSNVGVDLYVIISAYFLVDKQFKLKKLLHLWCETVFYCVFIYLIMLASGQVSFALGDLLNFLPVIASRYWFISAYFIFYLTVPILNIIINNVSKTQHLLIALGSIAVALIDLMPMNSAVAIYQGYSAIWFMFIFFVVSYLKRYVQQPIKWWICLLVILACTAISYFVVPFYSSPIGLLSALAIFEILKQIKINNKVVSKVINLIASTTLGVYLIHDNPYIRDFLYNTILGLDKATFYNQPYTVLISVGFVLAIFVVCSIIDLMRIGLDKLIRLIIAKVKQSKAKKQSTSN